MKNWKERAFEALLEACREAIEWQLDSQVYTLKERLEMKKKLSQAIAQATK